MTEPRFIRVPESIAERHRVRAERKRERDARYNKKRPDRDRGTRGKIPMVLRKFIVWDGEGPQDTGYSLLGNSEGEEICYPHLRTRDCLDLLLDSAARHPNTIHIGFGFNYDVSCILWELPWRCLLMLRKFTRTRWREYEIEHIPRKWFRSAKATYQSRFSMFIPSSLRLWYQLWKTGE